MRRALVLADEAALHPFRQSLPAHWRVSAARHPRLARFRLGSRLGRGSARGRRLIAPLLSGRAGALADRIGGARGFLAAYCASFVAASVFLG